MARSFAFAAAALLAALPSYSSASSPLPSLFSRSEDLSKRANPTVKTSAGTFQGTSDGSVDWFRGIPYAQPPGPGTRFTAAKPPKAKQGTQQATEFKSACPQDGRDGVSEDCLYINVARPAGVSYDQKLPALVWIHGGGFYNGAGSDNDPSPIVKQSKTMGKNIMVVTLNYRMNGFGFLYHPDVTNANNTNLGLSDQVAALRFLQQNLPAMGGDPSKVTIWGQSAGGASVEALTLFAPKDLFRASISNSGYFLSSNPAVFSGAAYSGQRETTNFWATMSAAGCGSEGSDAKKAFSCLQKKDYNSVQSAILSAQGSGNVHWAPVIAPGSMISEAPQSRLRNASFNHVPMIIGTTKDDGSYFAKGSDGGDISDEGSLLGFLKDKMGGDQAGAAKLLAMYKADKSLSDPTMMAWAAVTDWNFIADRRRVAQALSKNNNTVYAYLFSQELGDGSGVHHSSDLEYMFGTSKATDKQLSQTVISYYVNFVTSGQNPNGKSLPKWPIASSRKVQNLIGGGKTGAISDSFRRPQTNMMASFEVSRRPSSPSAGSGNKHRFRRELRPHRRAASRRSFLGDVAADAN